VWVLDIMPALLNLCGRRRWKPHMLCVDVLSDIMWQKGDRNHLIVLGLKKEKERHGYHGGESSLTDSLNETEDGNQGHEVPETRVEGFEYVENFKIPEEHVVLYKNIYEKHGHMATKKVIKFNDAMLLTCVTSLLKIISAMENVRSFEFNAEALEFNIKWLREGLNRLRNHWRSSFEIDKEVESHSQVLDSMQVKYVNFSAREDELNAELS
ncbi:hypothetical protein MKX03_003431, partial [Papaver bracteatum]